jgi:hypothetical protein
MASFCPSSRRWRSQERVPRSIDRTGHSDGSPESHTWTVQAQSTRAAKLRLYNATPEAERTIEALQLAGDWTESVVNWNNQPTTTSPPTLASWRKL